MKYIRQIINLKKVSEARSPTSYRTSLRSAFWKKKKPFL